MNLAVWWWPGHLPSLILSFYLCKIRTISICTYHLLISIIFTLKDYGEESVQNTWQSSWHLVHAPRMSITFSLLFLFLSVEGGTVSTVLAPPSCSLICVCPFEPCFILHLLGATWLLAALLLSNPSGTRLFRHTSATTMLTSPVWSFWLFYLIACSLRSELLFID